MIAIRRTAHDLTTDGADREAFIRMAAAELGYKRTSNTVAQAIDNALRAASRRRIIATGRGVVYADCRSIGGYPLDVLKKVLLQAIGRTWRSRDEAMVLTARALGFKRTGKNIKAALKSAITGLLHQGDIERNGGLIRRT